MSTQKRRTYILINNRKATRSNLLDKVGSVYAAGQVHDLVAQHKEFLHATLVALEKNLGISHCT